MDRRGLRAITIAGITALAGCDRGSVPSGAADASASPWDAGDRPPEPRPGMVWIPPGPLVVGTPPNQEPRILDEEMAGEQIVMRGFYIDLYLYPNEPGALPQRHLSQADAAALCQADGKRLCTELEVERACKGPENTAYPYGATYRPGACNTGTTRAAMPNGMNAACKSAFGVYDTHGSVWAWTASPWKRDPKKTGLITIRGGNGPEGEVVGRCANGRGVPADTKRDDIGVRCCAGEVNPAEVTLVVPRGEPLVLKSLENKAASLLQTAASEGGALPPPEPGAGRFVVERLWAWHPFGNEELWIAGGCGEPAKKGNRKGRKGCGLLVGRVADDRALALAWIPSGRWQPTLNVGASRRELLLYAGDEHGAYRRPMSWNGEKVILGEKARKKGKGDSYE